VAVRPRGHDACVASAGELLELVHERSPDEPHRPLFVVVDDAEELSESIAATALETIARRARDVNVRIIAACENTAARGYSPWIGELRKDGNGLLLSPDVDVDGDLLAVRLPRRSPRALVAGRGYVVSGGRVVLVQVAGEG
jgi:DNA segregation ATPase FtsK/SpoIIIE, S-DNA-T family